MGKCILLAILSIITLSAIAGAIIISSQKDNPDNDVAKIDQNLSDLIGGILQGDTPPDKTLFSSTIQYLTLADRGHYASELPQLDLGLEKRNMLDVTVQGTRNPQLPYRGIYINDIRDARWVLAHIDQVKKAGIDTLLYEIQYEVYPNTGRIYIHAKEVYLFYLHAFHRSGFRIWIAMGHTSYNFPYRHDSDNDRIGIPPLDDQEQILDMIEEHILTWAEIAEKYNVDTFIPSEEANTLLLEKGVQQTDLCQEERELLNDWMQEILPKVQTLFSGNVGFATNDGGPCERMNTPDTRFGPDFDYRVYDFIVYKFPFPSVFESDQKWDEFAHFALPYTSTFVSRDSAKGLILYETGDSVGTALQQDFAGSLPIRNTDKNHQKESYETYFQFLQDYEHIQGLFFKISDIQPHEPNWNPFGNPAEEVLRDNFASYGTLPVTDLDTLWIAIGEEGIRAIQVCLSEEVPFDPEYLLYEGESKQFYGRIKPLCFKEDF